MAGETYDVIVVGAGNAGLTAALAARQLETRVLLLDKCPKAVRGGNTRFSGGGFRFTYNRLDDLRPMLPDLTDEEAAKMDVGTYTNAEFFEDIMHVTEYARIRNSPTSSSTNPTRRRDGSRTSASGGFFQRAPTRLKREGKSNF